MAGSSEVRVSAYLRSTYHLLECAFPDGVAPQDYFPLLAALREKMSFRTLAEVVSAYTGKDYGGVYNDALGSESTRAPSPADVLRVKQRLLPCGYEQWLRED